MRTPPQRVLALALAASLAVNLLSIPRSPRDNGRTGTIDGRRVGRSSSSSRTTRRNDTATATIIPRFCVETTRCARLDRARPFSFVHVSKSGGRSWISELKGANLAKIYPRVEYGSEHSVAFQATKTKRPHDHLWYHLTSLRSPRHHAWSLWSQCRFSSWGERVTRKTAFPRGGKDAQGDVRDFAEWMKNFVDDERRSLRRPDAYRPDEWYNCYHPANYQSRPFVGSEANPHGVDPQVGLVPDIRIVDRTYRYMDWVGITEFFHESKCLLYYRMTPRTERMERYLDRTCRCPPGSDPPPPSNSDDDDEDEGSGGDPNLSDAKKVTTSSRPRETMRDLPPDVLEHISIATRVDVLLYRTALIQFVEEVAWLERLLSRRVLCEDVLREWEPELAYLNVSVMELYDDSKEDRRFR